MQNKLLNMVRQALAELRPAAKHDKGEEAQRDAWLEQLSDFRWLDDESDRAMPPEGEKKTWLEEMFGTTSPVNDGTIAANMADWQRGPAEEPEPQKRNSGQGMLLA